MAGEVLKVGGSHAQRVKTIEAACDRASDEDFKQYILPHCNTKQLDRILATVT
jgi:hypothetical protein